MKYLLLVGLLALAVAGFGAAMASAEQPGDPPGRDPCSHGNNGRDCVTDPSTHGKDCEAHGNQGGVNEDHCLPATTGTTGTSTTTPTIDTQCIGCTTGTTTGTTTTTPGGDDPPGGTTSTGTTTGSTTSTTPSGTTTAPPTTTAVPTPPVVTPPSPGVAPPPTPGAPPVVVGPNPPQIVTVTTGTKKQTYRLFQGRYYPIVRGNG